MKTRCMISLLLVSILVSMLVSFAPIFPQPVSIPLVLATPEEQVYTSHPHAHLTDISATDPTYAYDSDTETHASFRYSASSGTKKALELYTFDSPILDMSKVFGTLPPVSQVDFKMRYNVSANTGDLGDKYKIVYYVSATEKPVDDPSGVDLVDWRNDYITYVYVNGFNDAWKNWTRVGTSPYLDAIDYPDNYISEAAGSSTYYPSIGDFDFENVPAGSYGKVYIEIYTRQLTFSSPDAVQIWLYDESAASYDMVDIIWPENNTWSWQTTLVDVSSILDTTAKINNAKLYLSKRPYGAADNIEIDAMRLKVLNEGFVDVPTTLTWTSQPEPNDGTWDWYDIKNIRFAVETSRSGGADAGCYFDEYEAWVVVYAPKAELRVDPENTTAVSPGGSFSIDIKAFDVLDLSSYEFTLSYNTVVLNATSYLSYSPFTKYWGAFINDAAGIVGMSYSMPLGTTVGVSGDKAVAKITFVVDTTAGSLLDLESIGFGSAKGVEIPHDVFDGYYNRGAIPEFPLGMALELALIAVIAYVWWKRRSKTKVSKHIGLSSHVY